MIGDPELYELAARVGHKVLSAERRLVTAESCTGGWIAKTLTDIPGSSQWFECGYVTYSNAAKMRDLGVTAQTLERFGAVSEETAREMALGALRVSGASVAIAVTGIAGPDGGTPQKPVGTVWLCAAGAAQQTIVQARYFAGDRAFVRRSSVLEALRLVLQLDLTTAREGAPRAHRP